MQIINRGIMHITLGKIGDTMNDPKEWARELDKEIKASEKDVREEQQAVAMHRDIEAEKMPLLWDDLCVAFQQAVDAFNDVTQPPRKLYLHRVGVHLFTIKPDALPDIVNVMFDPFTKKATVKTSLGQHVYLPKVILIDAGSVAFVSARTRSETPVSKIAQDAIREGLTGR